MHIKYKTVIEQVIDTLLQHSSVEISDRNREDQHVRRTVTACTVSAKRTIMVSIPVFTGKEREDPEKFIRQFKRACMANGDRTDDSWLELLPIHLDDTASYWYDRQNSTTTATWGALTSALITEFQERESYQSLLGTLSLMK